MSHADANFRNTATGTLPILYDANGRLAVDVPRTTKAYPPFLELDCGVTLTDDLVSWGIHSFFRTSSLVSNQAYYARECNLRVDVPKRVIITVTSDEFDPYLSVVRDTAHRWFSAEGVVVMEVDLDTVGPFTVEVSSVDKYKTGQFTISVVCGATALLPLYSFLYPGTKTVPYFSYYNAGRLSATPDENLNLVTARVSLVPELPWSFPYDPPFTWDVEVPGDLPPGLTFADADANDFDAEITGTPTTSGTYTFTVRTYKDASQIAEQICTIEVRDKITIDLDFFVELWTPTSNYNPELLFSQSQVFLPHNTSGVVSEVNEVSIALGAFYSVNSDGAVLWSGEYSKWGSANLFYYDGYLYLYISVVKDFGSLFWTYRKASPGILGVYTLRPSESIIIGGEPATITLS